jgi:hypothetical protein
MVGNKRSLGSTEKRGGVRGFAVLTLEFHKEGRLWVGECRELGTATDGRSLDSVERELVKLAVLHLDGLEDIGERERVFRERGIKLYTDQPTTIERMVPVSADSQDIFVQFRTVPVPAPGPADRVAV